MSILLSMRSSDGDLLHHGKGIDLYERSGRCGSSSFLNRPLTVFTALSACSLLDRK